MLLMADFTGFSGRQEALERIKRFGHAKVMFYRSDLWLHERRVHALLQELLPLIVKTYPALDAEMMLALALVHDDAEVITGDAQLADKVKMSQEQLEALDREEEAAVRVLAARWPATFEGFSYEGLLMHALRKDCLEAQLVSYADKLDAYCEALHDVLAGNRLLTTSVRLYEWVIPSLQEKFPLLKQLLAQQHPLLVPVKPVDVDALVAAGKPHTVASLARPLGVPHYDAWRVIVRRELGEGALLTRREF